MHNMSHKGFEKRTCRGRVGYRSLSLFLLDCPLEAYASHAAFHILEGDPVDHKSMSTASYI